MSSASMSVQAISPIPLDLQDKSLHFMTTSHSHSSSSSCSPLTTFQWVQRKFPPRIRLKLEKTDSSSASFTATSSPRPSLTPSSRPSRIPSRIKLFNGSIPQVPRTKYVLPIMTRSRRDKLVSSSSRASHPTATLSSLSTHTPSAASSLVSFTDSPRTLKRKADSCPEPDVPKLKLKLRRTDTQETLPSLKPLPATPVTALTPTTVHGSTAKKPRVQPATQSPLKTQAWVGNAFDPDRQHQYDQEDALLIRDDPHHTQKKAHEMVRWAVATHPRLIKEYDVRELVGWGGCGAVLGGYRRSDKTKVAIKIIYKKKSHQGSLPSEIELLQNLDHPCIVKYYDSFQDERVYYLIMEHVGTSWIPHPPTLSSTETLPALVIHPSIPQDNAPGPVFLIVSQASCASLFDFIDYHGGQMPRDAVAPIFKSIASAISHLHSEGIVHGDIKEENVLIGMKRCDQDQGCVSRSERDMGPIRPHRFIAKLCDFGHALRAKRNHKSMVRYGTRDLSAPEFFDNLKHEETGDTGCYSRFHGFEQDIWALGLLLYTMVHGELPLELTEYIKGDLECRKDGSLPIDYDPTAGKECIDLMKRMLAVDPTRRIRMEGVMSHAFLRPSRKRTV